MEKNPYNFISFQNDAFDARAPLSISPMPDSLLRVYMVAVPLKAPVESCPQQFAPFVREGFTVVEWGGQISSDMG
ncbi:MAG: hypothetical protein IJP03_01280 [Christensenellaceae bacterium]|nr:hypothetical protein [Christensenellaceae bacterium]